MSNTRLEIPSPGFKSGSPPTNNGLPVIGWVPSRMALYCMLSFEGEAEEDENKMLLVLRSTKKQLVRNAGIIIRQMFEIFKKYSIFLVYTTFTPSP
jgi:hypothetical protein